MILFVECPKSYAKALAEWVNGEDKLSFRRMMGHFLVARVEYDEYLEVYNVHRPGTKQTVSFNQLHDAIWYVENKIV